MKKPPLYKRLSKYKVRKCIIEFPISSKKDIELFLKNRQYVDNSTFWIKGFVKVIILDSFLQIQHDIKDSKIGVRCFYDKQILGEILKYFENKMI